MTSAATLKMNSAALGYGMSPTSEKTAFCVVVSPFAAIPAGTKRWPISLILQADAIR